MLKRTVTLICVIALIFSTMPSAFANEEPAITEETIVIEEVKTEEEAAADPGITPDSPLYFIDLLMEKIQYALTQSPDAKIQLKADFIDERIAELEVLIEDGNVEYIEGLLTGIQADLESMDYVVDIKVLTLEDSVDPETETDAEPEQEEAGEVVVEEPTGEEAAEEPVVEEEVTEEEETPVEFEEVAALVALANEAKATILERISGIQEQLDALLASGEYDQQAVVKLENAIHFQNQIVTKIEQTTNTQVNRLNQILLDEGAEELDSAEAIAKIERIFNHKIAKSIEKSDRAMARLERAMERIERKAARKGNSDLEEEVEEETEIEDEAEVEEDLDEDKSDEDSMVETASENRGNRGQNRNRGRRNGKK